MTRLLTILALALCLPLTALAQANMGGGPAGAPGVAAGVNGLEGCVYNSSAPTAQSTQQVGFQCDTNGNLKVAIQGTITAANPSVAATGAAAPASATLIGGTNGTNLLPFEIDASGQLEAVLETGSTVAATQSGTWNIGTITTLPSITIGNTSFIATQATGTNLHAVLDATSTTAVTQATGTNLHAVLDTTSTTAVTQATATNLNAAVVGVGTAGSPSGNILTVQGVASMTPLLDSLQPTTSGGLTTFVLEPAASDNHTNIKNGAGQVYGIQAFNNSATINYIRLYNAASGFNGCNSATNLVWEGHIPANTSDAGFVIEISNGIAFSTGISICVTGAYGNTSTTAATASAISLNVLYK